jgi:hypothetical protein
MNLRLRICIKKGSKIKPDWEILLKLIVPLEKESNASKNKNVRSRFLISGLLECIIVEEIDVTGATVPKYAVLKYVGPPTPFDRELDIRGHLK